MSIIRTLKSGKILKFYILVSASFFSSILASRISIRLMKVKSPTLNFRLIRHKFQESPKTALAEKLRQFVVITVSVPVVAKLFQITDRTLVIEEIELSNPFVPK